MKTVFSQPSLFPAEMLADAVSKNSAASGGGGEQHTPSESTQFPRLPAGLSLLRNAFDSTEIFDAINTVVAAAPFRHMQTPGRRQMSVAMTNCGSLGWVSGTHGYRYSSIDPVTAQPWPAMPPILLETAMRLAQQAGYPRFLPDACLINRYLPGAQMGLHQDRDEKDFSQPIVSLSLGLPAQFIIGGVSSTTGRNARTQSIALNHGDAIVFGGAARLLFHGVRPLKPGHHPLLGNSRINLTFRVAK